MFDDTPDPVEAYAALSHLSDQVNAPRDAWIKLMEAFKNAGGHYEDFDAWSSTGHTYDQKALKRDWEKIKIPGKVTAASLYGPAIAKGFKRKESKQLDAKQAAEVAAARVKAQAEKDEVKKAAQAAAAERAVNIWSEATAPADEYGHKYLKAKGVKAHGLRVGSADYERLDPETGEVVKRKVDGLLFVPVNDPEGKMHSLQLIYQSGKKMHLKDGVKDGHFHTLGKPQMCDGKRMIILGEGYATCASVHEATGYTVLCCFDAGNLGKVAAVLRQREPETTILFAADNDLHHADGCNPGVTAARAAARAVGGLVVVPPARADAPTAKVDFNDLHQAEGLEAVAGVINAVLARPREWVVLVPTESEAHGAAFVYDALSRLEDSPARTAIFTYAARGIEQTAVRARDTYPGAAFIVLPAPADEVEALRVAQEFGAYIDLPPAEGGWRGWGEHMLDWWFAHLDEDVNPGLRQQVDRVLKSAGAQVRTDRDAWLEPVSRDLPVIEIREGERSRIIEELATAFARFAPYYRRDALLVRAMKLPADGEASGVWRSRGNVVLRQAMAPAVVSDASRVARVVKFDARSDRLVPKDLPDGIAASFCALGVEQSILPSIIGIVRCPVLRQDGSLHIHPGYDPATKLILAGDEDWTQLNVPEQPTLDDAKAALKWLLETAFADFPFADEASRSVALSALLTAVVRSSIPCAPLHGFSAPQFGAGKSLQAEFSAIVATGSKPSMIAPGHSQEEFEKRVDTALIEGDPVVVLDNLSRPLAGDNLCASLTSDTAKVRRLGSSASVTVRTSAFWMATGMNLSVKRDMHRRTVMSYIDAGMAHPEARSGFKIANLKEWAVENRMSILSAVYTMLRAHGRAGYPTCGEGLLGNFESWSRRVAHCLVWLGMVNPVRSQERLRADDPEYQNRIALMRALHDWQKSRRALGRSGSWTLKELRDAVIAPKVGYSELGEAIAAGVHDGIEGAKYWTRSNKNVTVNDGAVDYRLHSPGIAGGGVARWEVVIVRNALAPNEADDEPPI